MNKSLQMECVESHSKQGNKDIRNVISLGKLLRKGDGPEEIEGLVKTLAKCTNVN